MWQVKKDGHMDIDIQKLTFTKMAKIMRGAGMRLKELKNSVLVS
jgi:hypothetical protein